MFKQVLRRRESDRNLAGVRPLNSWRGLRQAATVSLLGTGLWGCGAPIEGDEPAMATQAEPGDTDWGMLEQAITGGTFTTAIGAVIKITQSGTPCTATKLDGTNKFLTAAHCIINEAATALTAFTGADGISGQISLSIPSRGIQIHPSFKLTGDLDQSNDYDVAVITTTTPTSIPGMRLPIDSTPPAIPSTVVGVGYGCDNQNPSNNGRRQFGFFELTGGGLSHTLTSSGPDVVCSGDSGGPLFTGANTIVGNFNAGPLGNTSIFSRIGNVVQWIRDPKPGNDPSLFQRSVIDLFFMHNKKVGTFPEGYCMVADSDVRNPPRPVNVILDKCSDPFGQITKKSSGWTMLSVPPAGRFALINRGTGFCLAPSSTSSGADLQVVACDLNFNTNLQKWHFTRTAASPFATLRIKNHATNLCVRTAAGGTSLGTRVEQITCDGGGNDSVQSWVATD